MWNASPPDELQIDHFSHFELCITPCVGKLPGQAQTHTHTHSPNSAKFRIGLFINNTIVHWVHSWVCSRDHLNYADLCPFSHTHTDTHTHTHTHTHTYIHTYKMHPTHIPISSHAHTNRNKPTVETIFTHQLSGKYVWTTKYCELSKERGNQRKGDFKMCLNQSVVKKAQVSGSSQSTLLCIQIGTCGAECRLTWVWLLREDAGIYLCQICQWVIYASCTKTFLFFTLPARTQLGESKSKWNQNRLYFLLYIPGLIRHDSSACYSN